MNFKRLSEYFSKIEKTPSRNEMTEILSRLYSECNSDEVGMISYLVIGRVAPLFINAEFNVATKTLIDCLKLLSKEVEFSGDPESVYNNKGDLGLAVESILNKSKKQNTVKSPSISTVYSHLWDFVKISGIGSVEKKKNKIVEILKKLAPIEAKYLMKILSQELRLGSSSKTILDALSFSSRGDKSDRSLIERAYGVCSDLGFVAQTYIQDGKIGLENINIKPGVPIFSMLVEREKDVEKIIERIANPIVQPKFDGLRCQIHVGVDSKKSYENTVWSKYFSEGEDNQGQFFQKKDLGVRLFSRNLEELTDMFPDVVEAIKKLDIKSGVFDSEIVGFDEKTGEYATFQSTMIRRRKYSIENAVAKQPIRAFIFDVLYLDGKSLLDKTNIERVKIMEQIIPNNGVISASESVLVSNKKELEKQFNEKINAGLEGIIIKDQNSKYQPGARCFDWIKLKRASQGQLADTVDVVILGYYFGRGKQANFGIGALLGGIYDNKKDKFATLTKIGTGVTYEQWSTIRKDLSKFELKGRPDIVECKKSIQPDVWVRPSIVATIEADEITRSPIHTAGVDKKGVGYALRFPRLKVWGRDKLPEESTSVDELKRMYSLSRKE